mmetsp:Transcript_14892/g.42748  ORF Transcript_14892/g.42748 Transcript_14892/m.42748 type:complete len:332 (-) Transcript_14892:341-1336(-)
MVKGFEGCPDLVLVELHPRGKEGRDEGGVVHLLVVRKVKAREDALHLLGGDLEILVHDLGQLIQGDDPPAGLVERQEGLLKVLQLPRGQAVGHHGQGRSPQVRALGETPEALEHIHAHVGRRERASARDPGVLQGPRRVQPRARVLLQQALEEVLRVAGQGLPPAVALEVALEDGLGYLEVVRAAERWPAEQQHVADDPQAPQVALAGVLPRQDLGAGVVQRTAGHVQRLVGRAQALREPEVYQLQSVVALQLAIHPVLQLEIPVHYAVAVEIVQRLQHLKHDVGSVALMVHLPLAEPAVQLAAAELHDEPDVPVALVGVEQPADVRMVQP